MYLPQDAFDWALNVMVVHSGDRTILIDAGLGMDPDLQLPRAGQLIRRLGAAGINLGEITDVVITHMHMDHVGGLLVEGVKKQLRPDLKIHVAAAEVEFWKSPDFSRTNMPQGFPDALRATAKHFWAEYSSYVHTFQDEQQIAPGVTARRTGGHTPGHCVVRVASAGQALTFAGDAVFAVGFDQPNWHNGFEHDPEESARVRIALLKELAGTGEMLVATHLPFPSVGRVSLEGETFRWVPVFWDF